MLHLTGVKLELLTDMEKVDLVERGIRGGLSMAPQKYMDTIEDPSKSLHYLDANNLYGNSMREPMPASNFEWVTAPSTPEEFEERMKGYDPQADIGYMVEVDLDYPEQLHHDHSDFPLCPEKSEIRHTDFSDFTKKQFNYVYPNKSAGTYKATKLTATLQPKIKVILHIRVLLLYLSLGMKLKKVHRILQFTQSRFLSEYIDKCTSNRRKSTSSWEKSLWKLFCNACYGKFIENTSQYRDIKLCNSEQTLMKHMTNPLFDGMRVISDTLQIINLKQAEVKLNKPIYCGLTILELSKYHMYYFWYYVLKPTFKSKRLTLHMHDTDSFIFSIDTGAFLFDLLKPRSKLRDLMDFSNLPLSEIWSDFGASIKLLINEPLSLRKNEPGYFKCEMNWGTLLIFVALRSKVYSLKMLPPNSDETSLPKNKNVCKGVRGIKEFLDVISYKQSLLHQLKYSLTGYALLKRQQRIQLVQQRKVALASFDDKQYALCPVHSLPYGSKNISEVHTCEYLSAYLQNTADKL